MSLTDELKAKMEQEPDVKRVLAIERMGSLFRYMIETPFESFPKFVIGTCNADFEEVYPIFKCGLESSARHAWEAASGVQTDERFRKVLSLV